MLALLLLQKYSRVLIEKGVYTIPIASKQSSVNYAHTKEDIDTLLQLTRAVFRSV
jgi:glutamate-1-semialdehyde aminotransferase